MKTVTLEDGQQVKVDDGIYNNLLELAAPKSYREVAKILFQGNMGYHTNADGVIIPRSFTFGDVSYNDTNNAKTYNQLNKLMAINRVMNVANYLNKGEVENYGEAWTICMNTSQNNLIFVNNELVHIRGIGPYFKTKELAEKAIEILGDSDINLALTTHY